MHFDCEIDTRRDNCPVPVIKAHLTLKSMAPSQVIRILAANDSTRNFEAFARSAHYQVLHKEIRGGDGIEMLIEKTPHG
ncbi:MAG: sulfurtransferase TusA family protein [Gammaproteobacteria bacterium]|nr:sulfurtransferase TusA family protein [Gammaproteobacteria bacterium]MBU1645317.1 sulfurtransferase TusA family protein [Gammaproteobacteria bacterium]MBU1972310.1 sulfurtransferase TusA family protein [Gammaproteobacteria bacterium]